MRCDFCRGMVSLFQLENMQVFSLRFSYLDMISCTRCIAVQSTLMLGPPEDHSDDSDSDELENNCSFDDSEIGSMDCDGDGLSDSGNFGCK